MILMQDGYYHQTREAKVNGILQELEMSGFKFYLTGSRFFIPHRDHYNDWDFFTAANEDVGYFLKTIGFKCNTDTTYEDIQTISVWEFGSEIDIQIVHCVSTKKRAQEILRGIFPNDSSFDRKIWNRANECAIRVCSI